MGDPPPPVTKGGALVWDSRLCLGVALSTNVVTFVTRLGRPLLLHLLPVQTWPRVLNAVDVRSTADGLNEVWGDQPRGTV